MTEEKYKNGDIHWNTYSGKFKMFDKDGNEIPYDCLEQTITRLGQENKDLKKQIESDKGLITVGGKQQYEYLQKIDELEQENKELLKYETYYLDKYIELRDLLEEIRKIASPHCSQCVEILNKINEVLNE